MSLYSRVEEIINDWDPIDLLSFAPSNEYEREINKVTDLILSTSDQEEIARGIENIFIDAFSRDNFTKTLDECREISIRIIQCI